MGKQGNSISESIKARCIQLLTTTDLSMAVIAKRLDISSGVVKRINDEFRIREYKGQHVSFVRAGESVANGWS